MDQRSERNLVGVNTKLVAVVRRAHEMMDETSNGLSFIVTEGVRSVFRQRELVSAGASRTMSSYHLTGDAIDFAATVNGDVRWDWPLYGKIARRFKEAALELGYRITWGGDWDGDGSSDDQQFMDGPHIQIEDRDA